MRRDSSCGPAAVLDDVDAPNLLGPATARRPIAFGVSRSFTERCAAQCIDGAPLRLLGVSCAPNWLVEPFAARGQLPRSMAA